MPAPSIVTQTISFSWAGRRLEVEAGFTTPLYETIAEVVDFDCYRLREVAADALAGSTLIDVGANVGVTSLCLAQFPGVRVLSVEPDARNCAQLGANLRRNGAENARVLQRAVARTTGRALMSRPEAEDVGGRLLADGESRPGESLYEVKTLNLRDLMAATTTAIGLMKVDCEGGEFEIVDQITPELAGRLPLLTFEIHEQGPERGRVRIAHQLERLGYTLAWKPDPFGRGSLSHLLATRLPR
jgi:FkbM family methyltransferase